MSKQHDKPWYKRTTLHAVALYVILIVAMEAVMLALSEWAGLSEDVSWWLRHAQPWVVIVLSLIFIVIYGRSWQKHYRRPTDLLSDYLQNSPTIHFELRRENDNFRVHWVSKNAEKLLGYSIDEIKASNWWFNHLHPADRNAVVKKAIRGVEEPEFLYEYRFQHADGHYIWIRDQIRQDDDSGKRIKGSWLNISTEFNSPADSPNTEISQHFMIGQAELDNERRVSHIDKHFEKIIGLSNDEVKGTRLEDILTPVHSQKSAAFEPGETFAVVGRRKDFTRFKAQLIVKQCDKTDRLIACLADLSHIEQQYHQLVQEAYHDETTGLPNLRNLHESFNELINSLPDDRLAALVTININQFYQLTKRYGGLVGAQALQRIARRLKEALPFGSKLYSAGNDEFIVLINNITEYIDVQVISDKLLSVFEQKLVINQDAQFHLTCSAGASIYPLDGYDSEQLVTQSRAAMLAARHGHASNAVIFQQDVEQPSHTQLQLAEDIQSALQKQQLEMFYQPILDDQRRVVAAEALLRWHHPEFGLLSAGEFLRHAEHGNALTEIGFWVLSSVCNQLAQWQDDNSPIKRVSINLSTSQLSSQLSSEFAHQLADNPELKGGLAIEVSEGALNEADEAINGTIQQLSQLGIAVIIDDFGTGFSSLNYLADYPIDTVKIDRSLVRSLTDNERTQRIVAAMIKIAKEAGVEVIAEGIENERQLELILQLGCQKWQGHLIHPAKPVGELINLD